jgi:hypothetical protein
MNRISDQKKGIQTKTPEEVIFKDQPFCFEEKYI